jgi:class 3 adenylate cyclase/tetratricopeptide (TPR) repeat protein
LAAGPAPRQQRKTVTVLFCDVAGSTALGERLDPESFRQVMRQYFDAARLVIERHGGTVEKFIGDAVMAVFGVPVLHEDDALRAVRAAVELRAEIALLSRQLEAGFGATLSVRTGVNTGEVVTGTEERLATGDAVNLAARLEQAAAPGEVVIGSQTWRLVRGAVAAEPLEPLLVRGKSQPVAAYRLLRVRSDVDSRVRPAGAPLVGRGRQLRMLGDVFANVVRERSCSLFTVLGMAGVGKSRLAAEFLGGIDARVVTGSCLSYGQGITYWPVISMVRQLLDARHGCAGAAGLMARDAKVAAAVNVLLGELAAATSPAEIAWAMRKLLESSADLAPLVVVVDDLQWAEPALFDLIEHVANFSRGAPILVVCLARPELLDARPGWGGGKLNAATLLLEPLKPAETAALIDELVPAGSEIDARLRERVQVTAAGNPLFVEEMLALAVESGGDLVVPPTIQALLAARLDQLAPGERTVLECGSVEGESFHRSAIEVMAPEEHDLPGRLMTLVRKDLVRPDRAVLPDEDAFRFRHLLIRDAAYQALAKADRAELHERVARWLEQRVADLAELDEIAGYHLEQAYRYRRELGPAEEKGCRLAADAAAHLDTAGRRAMDRGDTAAAVNLLERAEALLPPDQVNLHLQHCLIRGLGDSGKFKDAITRAARIANHCSAAGDRVGELTARLAGMKWQVSLDPERWLAELGSLVNEARPVVERDGDAAARAAMEYAAGFFDYCRRRNAAAFAAFTQAMQYARQAGELWFETSIRTMAAVTIVEGPTLRAEALRWLDDAQARSATYQPWVDACKASVLADVGRFDEARSLLAGTVARMNERGMLLPAALVINYGWQIETLAGDLVAAERAARQCCEQLEQLGDQSYLSTHECMLADALYALGRYAESEQWASRGLELGSRDDIATQLYGLSVRSRLLARKGDIRAAFALAEQVDGLAGTSQDPSDQGDAALNRAEILYLAGDSAEAEVMTQRAVASYQRNGGTARSARALRFAAAWARRTSPASSG